MFIHDNSPHRFILIPGRTSMLSYCQSVSTKRKPRKQKQRVSSVIHSVDRFHADLLPRTTRFFDAEVIFFTWVYA